MLNTLNPLALFGSLGTPEIILIVVAVLLLFGGKKLPELARGIGRGLRVFKEEVEGVKQEFHESANEDAGESKKTQPPSATPPSQKSSTPDEKQD